MADRVVTFFMFFFLLANPFFPLLFVNGMKRLGSSLDSTINEADLKQMTELAQQEFEKQVGEQEEPGNSPRALTINMYKDKMRKKDGESEKPKEEKKQEQLQNFPKLPAKLMRQGSASSHLARQTSAQLTSVAKQQHGPTQMMDSASNPSSSSFSSIKSGQSFSSAFPSIRKAEQSSSSSSSSLHFPSINLDAKISAGDSSRIKFPAPPQLHLPTKIGQQFPPIPKAGPADADGGDKSQQLKPPTGFNVAAHEAIMRRLAEKRGGGGNGRGKTL